MSRQSAEDVVGTKDSQMDVGIAVTNGSDVALEMGDINGIESHLVITTN